MSKALDASITTVAGATSSTSLLAANINRKGAVIVNDSTAILYVALAEAASTSNYTFKLQPDEAVSVEDYSGPIFGIWASATGNARLTEAF